MPASNKMLKKREHANNKAAGLGDKDGKLVRVKAEMQTASCTVCSQSIRVTKTNTELHAHADSKHPKKSYAECFPGQA
jgi:roadblock/LC7 domain-containing protein